MHSIGRSIFSSGLIHGDDDNNHEPVASLDWGDERRRLDENSNQKFISYFQGDEKGWTNTK